MAAEWAAALDPLIHSSPSLPGTNRSASCFSIYPLLDSKESVEVIEAAPVDARIAELEAELDRLRRIEKAARGALSVSRSVLDHSVREMP